MRGMRKRRLLISFIVVTAFLLMSTITYALLRDDDPYKYFTGMGEEFDISPDDQYLLFSYYVDGKEGIYRANGDGTDVRQLTSSETERHHTPKYSFDGTKILFLSKNSEGINSLTIANQDGSQQKSITPKNIHVSEAAFSSTGETIYYVGVSADAFKKAEGETTEGFDLFTVNVNGENIKKLTDKNYFSMTSLSVSSDGRVLYYSVFDGHQDIVTSFSLENGKEKEASISKLLPINSYNHRFSPDEDKWIYTAVSEESENNSIFEYELFLIENDEQQSKRLTDLNSSVVSPRFLHHKNQLAFLEHTNWPDDPAKNDLYVVDLGTGDLQPIELALTTQGASHWFINSVNQLVNGRTIGVLYIVLMGLLTTYLHHYHSKRTGYIPAIASFILTAIVLIGSIIVTFIVDPWIGIGLGSLAVPLFGCTAIVFGYALVLNLVDKRN